MYKFLMVDDEEIVRRGFKRKIDWASLGFELLEPCENGREAIEAIETLHPDVVMTDIYMPHVDGLAVAAHAAEHHPEIVIMILSGYDEFEYAQKAIRNRVYEYVLKPVTSRELTNLLVKLRAKLDSNRRALRDQASLKERADRSDAVLRTRSLQDLVSGSLAAPEEEWFRNLFGFSPAGLSCAAVVAERAPAILPEEGSAAEKLSQAVAASLGAGSRTLAFQPGENRESVLVFEPSPPACERAAAALAGRIEAAAEARATVGIGRAYESWVDAARTHEEAVAALSYRLVASGGKPFLYTQAREDDPACVAELASHREKVCRAVTSGGPAEAGAGATRLFAAIESARLSPQRVRHEIGGLFAAVIDRLNELGVAPATVSADLGVDYDQAVQKLRTSEEVVALLATLTEYAGSVLAQRNLPAPQWKVLDFKEIVSRHYAEKDLSVQNVAEKLSISASYLTKLIKRHLETSFVDFLTDFRLARARELLDTTDLMTYEIAEATGYPDAHYFSSTFKKRLGMTPSEFRAQGRKRRADP